MKGPRLFRKGFSSGNADQDRSFLLNSWQKPITGVYRDGLRSENGSPKDRQLLFCLGYPHPTGIKAVNGGIAKLSLNVAGVPFLVNLSLWPFIETSGSYPFIEESLGAHFKSLPAGAGEGITTARPKAYRT
ncbi:hypothetical protein [Desulfosarcina cetonica]